MKMREAWDKQREFTERAFPVVYGMDFGSPVMVEQRTRITREYILSMISELVELLHELPDWKHHRAPESRQVVETNVYEELADVQKFLWGLAMVWGLDYEGMAEQVLLKSLVVETRWHQEKELPGLLECQKVAVIDIDGVLTPWLENLKLFRDKMYPSHNLDIPEVRELVKDAYRREGFDRQVKVLPGVVSALVKLRGAGYTIVLLTRRPYHLYKRQFSDTVSWLRENELQFDHIYWAAGEKTQTLRTWKDSVAFVVDDEVDNCEAMAALGLKVYCVSQVSERSFLRSTSHFENIIFVENLEKVVELELRDG